MSAAPQTNRHWEEVVEAMAEMEQEAKERLAALVFDVSHIEPRKEAENRLARANITPSGIAGMRALEWVEEQNLHVCRDDEASESTKWGRFDDGRWILRATLQEAVEKAGEESGDG